MNFNLKDMHWQEFEVLAFKVLQKIVAAEVHYLEGEVIKDASKRMGTKYIARLILNTTSDDGIEIDKLFEVKSSMKVLK